MKSNDEIFNEIKEQLLTIKFVKPDAIPNIDLYMDQVTTFMDNNLFTPEAKEGEHIMTKTMINNYAKSELIPPPIKKKYSKDHMLMLIFIHYLKNFISINDIKSLFQPVKDNYLDGKSDINLEYIYREIFSGYQKQLPDFIHTIENHYETSKTTFDDIPEEDAHTLQLISFISSLSFDIYLKKYMVESLIEQLSEQYNASATDDKSVKKEK